jgi:two-component system phosphate regulon response regulator PhoB
VTARPRTPPPKLSGKILVIEDEADLQKILQFHLKQAGYEVIGALDAARGIEAARGKRPEMIVLDLMLPDRPGTEVLRELKSHPQTRGIPVLVLTAKGEEVDRVVGFELGADDYVVKPVGMRELVLRVRAILRRAQDPEPASGEIARFGRLAIDRAAHRVRVEEREVPLTALEFRLLTTLFDRRDRVQSRERLLADVWDIEADVTTRTVDTHVKRLRQKLGAAGEYVETVRGVGYRFRSSPDR